MSKKKQPSKRKRAVLHVQKAQVLSDPYALTIRIPSAEVGKLFQVAAREPAFASQLSEAIRTGNVPLMRSLFRARGIRTG